MLVFAMVTNRTLWVEWEQQNSSRFNAIESGAASDYDSLFQSPLHERRRRPPDDVMQRLVSTDMNCAAAKFRFSHDLNVDYPMDVVRLNGCDWQGGLLMRNKAYADTVLKGLNPVQGLNILIRALFTLQPPHVPQELCSWLIQYRHVWPLPYMTANIRDFIACARRHGMQESDYATTWVLTDDRATMLELADQESRTVLARMNYPTTKRACKGVCGDRATMESVYRLSGCRNAVLTHASSFGACVTSIAPILKKLTVGPFGECMVTHLEPLDPNSQVRGGGYVTYLSTL